MALDLILICGVIVKATEDITDLTAGNYSVVVTDDNSCVANGNATVNLVTALMNNQSVSLNIYPNPINDKIIIELPVNDYFNIVLLDLNGKLIISKNAVSEKVILNAQELPMAAYLLQIYNAKNQQLIGSKRLMKN